MELAYDYNINDVYFDGIQLYKEQFGQSYANAGNILSYQEYAYTTGELGTPANTVSYGYDDSSWGDLLTAYDGSTITYDEVGNPLSDGTWTYTWEHVRVLSRTGH